MTLFNYVKVEANFVYQKDPHKGEDFSFGSVSGAKRWVEENRKDLRWVSIEGLSAHPCKEDNPDGQLYYGMTHFEFIEFEKEG